MTAGISLEIDRTDARQSANITGINCIDAGRACTCEEIKTAL